MRYTNPRLLYFTLRSIAQSFFLRQLSFLVKLESLGCPTVKTGKNRMVVCPFCVQMQMNSSPQVASFVAAFSAGSVDWLID